MNIYIKACFILAVFYLLQYLYNKYNKIKFSFKQLIKDTIFIGLSSIIGIFLYEKIYVKLDNDAPSVFTGSPNF